jgi:type I restriction enzyme R subunit
MNIPWEYEVVERPFCQQLEQLGWEWIEGDPDLPETTDLSDKLRRGRFHCTSGRSRLTSFAASLRLPTLRCQTLGA